MGHHRDNKPERRSEPKPPRVHQEGLRDLLGLVRLLYIEVEQAEAAGADAQPVALAGQQLRRALDLVRTPHTREAAAAELVQQAVGDLLALEWSDGVRGLISIGRDRALIWRG